MKELQQLYRRALVDLIRELERERPRAAAGDAAATAAIRRTVHSLRGSGGTYGFPEITAAAAAIETEGDAAGAPLTELIRVLRIIAEPAASAGDSTT